MNKKKDRVFVIGDTHFNHANILKMVNKDGFPVRPFKDVQEMNNHMFMVWNNTVKPEDTIYHLGDVFFMNEETNLPILQALNGKKHLILGNHDHMSAKKNGLLSVFETISGGARWFDGVVMTHYPIHPDLLGEYGTEINVHGHTHGRVIPDVRYFNASAEVLGYCPVLLTEVFNRVATTSASLHGFK